MKISASMIVKNEQACIEACLKSIQGLDEIVVLDTGSTDRTPEICRKYTNKVHVGEYVWRDDFAEARNESLKRCAGDWIFIIDADEILATGAGSVRSAAQNGNGDSVLMTKVVSGDTALWSPRLFRNHSGVQWRGAIHNYLTKTGTTKTGVVVECGSSDNHKKDPDRTFRILKKEVAKNPDCVREKYYLAREYYYRGEWTTAIEWFNAYLRKAFWGPEWADAWCILAKCYCRTGDYERARKACFEAIKINADFQEPMLMLAALSGPKNREKWKALASTCKNEDVLFIRIMDFSRVLK